MNSARHSSLWEEYGECVFVCQDKSGLRSGAGKKQKKGKNLTQRLRGRSAEVAEKRKPAT
jgi:hypothetical protein